MWILNCQCVSRSHDCPFNNKDQLVQWHNRLGHLSITSLRVLFPSLFKYNVESDLQCEVCQLSIHVRNTYSPSINNKILFIFLRYTVVWGLSPITSFFGFQYFLSFVDDYSWCTWVYLMKTKREVSSIFHTFHRMVQTQFGISIKFLKSDNGGEYISSQLQKYVVEYSIIHQTSCVHTL